MLKSSLLKVATVSRKEIPLRIICHINRLHLGINNSDYPLLRKHM